ncbi:dioxygenase [Lentibacillus kapialis]|uniref:Dioxygenase n=1 Tax=Lentibacillus kapialis TaxID=340214 RepID=A0A917UVH0_9BACI|nr:SDR family oxidoreductase [Lentibacillus kapialis]GGJ87712.1 dioxygenase [Lentibacillus kapialis]
MELPFQIDLNDKVAVVTGGSGVLGSVFAAALAKAGAKVAVLARTKDKIDAVIQDIKSDGGEAIGYSVDVLDKKALEDVHADVKKNFGRCSILINGAGGNNPKATTSKEYFDVSDVNDASLQSFFDLEQDGVSDLFNLNFLGTLLPTQVFARDMTHQNESTIINISSMNAYTPLTKIPAYSGAKAAISNFTQWLAVHFSKAGIRVNAMAPGFFLTEQNRDLMIREDGELSERANKILSQTPMERFGEPEELVGTLLWLVDHKSSSFVNGIVVPVDGGFSSYSGV